MKRALFVTLLCCLSGTTWAGDNLQGLLQMLDYMSVDYPEAVQDGRVVNAAEYEEMREFAAAIAAKMAALPDSPEKGSLLRGAEAIGALVARRGPAGELTEIARGIRESLLSRYDVAVVPRQAPDFQKAEKLYAEQCASCHGVKGRGDGPLAPGMVPPPIDFTDTGRAAQRSIFGLYNTITLGVEETAMPGFGHLSDAERWSLAFWVGRFGLHGGEDAAVPDRASPVATLRAVTTLSPAEVSARYGDGQQRLYAALRADPAPLFAARPDPIAFSRQQLAASLEAYRSGEREAAYQLALSAYLEGFELAESGLEVAAPDLKTRLEHGLSGFRNAVRGQVSPDRLAEQARELDGWLTEAQSALAERELSGREAFAGATLILLREGLEAILVVAALAAFLARTGRRDGLRYLHAGWVGALLAGIATWWVAENLIAISGAGRELTEGVAAIVAAGVLFYVGFWLHSKTASVRWKQFIEGSVQKALTTSTLWSLAGLSFIAVYREVFETLLFYQALWAQAGPSAENAVLAGALFSSAVLAVLAFVIIRSSARLPLRQFFGITGVLMFALALVFAGKGIAAFQEAGKLPVSPVELLPAIDLLGIYPNLQSLGVQLAMLAVGTLLFYRQRSVPARIA